MLYNASEEQMEESDETMQLFIVDFEILIPHLSSHINHESISLNLLPEGLKGGEFSVRPPCDAIDAANPLDQYGVDAQLCCSFRHGQVESLQGRERESKKNGDFSCPAFTRSPCRPAQLPMSPCSPLPTPPC